MPNYFTKAAGPLLSLSLLCVAASGLRAQTAVSLQSITDPQNVDACLGASTVMSAGPIGFETFMTSAIKFTPNSPLPTVTLPLHQGFDQNGNKIYYILTDTSDCTTAQNLHINYAPKLAFLLNWPGTGTQPNGVPGKSPYQTVTVDQNGLWHFQGTATFTPNSRQFVPGASPNGWPPTVSVPGSVADSFYSPYVNVSGTNIILNASQVADAQGNHKNFATLNCSVAGQNPCQNYVSATFNMVMGIYDFDFVMYLRMDASDPTITGFEGGIYAPNPENTPLNGQRYFADSSARQSIFPILNGFNATSSTASYNATYERQGLSSSALSTKTPAPVDPFNVMGATPGESMDYSPIWDVTPVMWTPAAIAAGFQQRLHMDDEIAAFVKAGYLTGLSGLAGNFNDTNNFPGQNPALPTSPTNPSNVLSFGAVSNCPIMLRVMSGIKPYNQANPDGGAGLVTATMPTSPDGGVTPAGSNCNGVYNGTYSGNVTVSSGQTCQFSAGGVSGNITVMTGGNLILNGATVTGAVQTLADPTQPTQNGSTLYIGTSSIGSLQAQNLVWGSVQLCGSSVTGNVQISGNAVPVQIGAASNLLVSMLPASVGPTPTCAGNTVGGSVQVGTNTALEQISGNTVTGDIQSQSNSSTWITSNKVTGNLTIQSNGSATVTSNKVGASLSCSGNTTITGSGNTGSPKQGQCSTF